MDLLRLGRGVRALRQRRGWRQSDLAGAAGLSRPVVGRIERGESAAVSISDLSAVAIALESSLDVVLRWKGEGLDRLLDDDHARIVERLVAWLRAHGWVVAVEVSFSRFGERGSIDVMAFHPATRALAVFEVKSVTPDMQAMLAGLDRKARLGPAIAKERGWNAAVTARILVLADTSTNRRRLARFGAMVSAALPAGTWDVRHWLEEPTTQAIAGVWFLAYDRAAGTNRSRRLRVRVGRGASRSRSGVDSAT
jgi:transcriptional regulator with XRE-family HTH domain